MSDYLYVEIHKPNQGPAESRDQITQELRSALPRSILPKTRDQVRLVFSVRGESVLLEPFVANFACFALLHQRKRNAAARAIIKTLVEICRKYGKEVSILTFRDTGRRMPVVRDENATSIDEVLDKALRQLDVNYHLS